MAGTIRGLGGVAATIAGLLCVAPTAVAQGQQPAGVTSQSRVEMRASGNPRRDTAVRMLRPITIEFNETRLEDVMKFLADVSGADIEVMWADERSSTGLDKEQQISLRSRGASALAVLDKVLEKVSSDSAGSGGATWQFTPSGTLQIGPKARLNAWKRVELYPINDLLLELPTYTDAPEFDLQSVLQASQGGGGGGQSPFRDTNNQDRERLPLDQRAQDLIQILTQLVETEQWADNGGDGGTIRYFQGSLLVNAPDYMHRALQGYSWWPQGPTRVAMVKGRRYVTLSGETAANKIDDLVKQPVTGVVPGGGGGGGGNPPPPPPPPNGPK